MPEQLQPVLDFIKASFMMSNDLLIQGVIIAVLLGFIMSRMGQIIFYLIVALLLDLFVVPLARMIVANDMNFGGAVEYLNEIWANMSADGMQAMGVDIGHRAVFFLIAIIVVRLLSSVIRRS